MVLRYYEHLQLSDTQLKGAASIQWEHQVHKWTPDTSLPLKRVEDWSR